MPPRIKCPNGHRLRVRPSSAGKRVRCPACKGVVRVPTDLLEESDSPADSGTTYTLQPGAEVVEEPVFVATPVAPSQGATFVPSQRPATAQPMGRETEPEVPPIRGALFLHPLRGPGMLIIPFEALALTVGGLLLGMGFVAIFFMFGQVVVAIYCLACFREYMTHAASGGIDPPPWAEPFGDVLLLPLWHTFIIGIFTWFPVAAMAFVTYEHAWLMTWCLFAWAVFYSPAAFLSITLLHTVSASVPWVVLPALSRFLLPYLTIVSLWGGLLVVGFVMIVETTEQFAGSMADFGLLALGWVIVLYADILMLTMLGRAYYRHSRRIGWFAQDRHDLVEDDE